VSILKGGLLLLLLGWFALGCASQQSTRRGTTQDHRAEVFGKQLEAIEGQRAQALVGLSAIQETTIELLERERERLSRTHGSDHPRVREIEGKLEYNQELVNQLNVLIQEARIGIPESDRGGWMVHGWITDLRNQGMGGMTVSLYDRDMLFEERLGSSVTDEDGYFMLLYHSDEEGSDTEDEEDFYVRIKGRKPLSSSGKSKGD
jgi:hypothetical protein